MRHEDVSRPACFTYLASLDDDQSKRVAQRSGDMSASNIVWRRTVAVNGRIDRSAAFRTVIFFIFVASPSFLCVSVRDLQIWYPQRIVAGSRRYGPRGEYVGLSKDLYGSSYSPKQVHRPVAMKVQVLADLTSCLDSPSVLASPNWLVEEAIITTVPLHDGHTGRVFNFTRANSMARTVLFGTSLRRTYPQVVRTGAIVQLTLLRL
jgi:hypothetical protein